MSHRLNAGPLHRATRFCQWALLAASPANFACATAGPTVVSPAEIPILEARIEAEPGSGDDLHRYAAALFSADRCEDAAPRARTAIDVDPGNVVGSLVLGRCLEEEARFDEALEVYSGFLANFADARGVKAIEAQQRLALRARAVQHARNALEREAELTAQPGDPQAVAVLPLLVEGGPEFAPLSRGLASIIISDLDLLRRFRLVERMEIDAIMDELDLAQSERADPATTARVGRFVSAGRTVQGTAALREEEEARLTAAVLTSDSPEPGLVEATGRLEDLLDMEKQLVFGIAEVMGYRPSLAERTRIEGNGTRNLAALLAYSMGLEAEGIGDYDAAILHFRDALQRDPSFIQAEEQLEIAAAEEAISTEDRGQVTTIGADADEAAEEATGSDAGLGDALANSVFDVAALDSERATQSVGESDASREISSLPGFGGKDSGRAAVLVSGSIRIIIIIP